MLGLGWTEMLVIGVVALIVIGPKDLPVVMQRIGQFAGQIRRMGAEFQREINKTTGLDEVRNLRNSITAPLKKTTDEIRREFNAMTPTGVKPTGVIKPADPSSESVVEEIRAAAGMPPSNASDLEAMKGDAAAAPVPAPVKTEPEPTPAIVAKPAARKGPVKAKPAPTRPVVTTELAPLEEKAVTIAEPAPPPAGVEEAASTPPKRAARKPAAAEAAADATPKPRKRAARPADSGAGAK